MGLTYGNYTPISTGNLVAGRYIRADYLGLMYENYNRLLGNYGRVIAENVTSGGNLPGYYWYQQTDVLLGAPNYSDIWSVYHEFTQDFATVTVTILVQAITTNINMRAFVGAWTSGAQVAVVGAGWNIFTFAAMPRGAANPISIGVEANRAGAGGYLRVAYVTARFDAIASPHAAGPQLTSLAYPSEINHYAQTEPHATWQHRQIFAGMEGLVESRPTYWNYSNIYMSPATFRGAWSTAATAATEMFRFRIKPKTLTVKIYALAAVNAAPNVVTIRVRSSVDQLLVSNTSVVAATPTRADWILVGTLGVQRNQYEWLVAELSVTAGTGYLYGLCVREVW